MFEGIMDDSLSKSPIVDARATCEVHVPDACNDLSAGCAYSNSGTLARRHMQNENATVKRTDRFEFQMRAWSAPRISKNIICQLNESA